MKYKANCEIRFNGKVVKPQNPKRCPEGGEIPNVVVRSSLTSAATPAEATCGTVVQGGTGTSQIFVKAMIDRIKFGNKNSTLNIGQEDKVGQEVKAEVPLKKIEVRFQIVSWLTILFIEKCCTCISEECYAFLLFFGVFFLHQLQCFGWVFCVDWSCWDGLVRSSPLSVN